MKTNYEKETISYYTFNYEDLSLGIVSLFDCNLYVVNLVENTMRLNVDMRLMRLTSNSVLTKLFPRYKVIKCTIHGK